jgi:8-oxo-dGTP pyrophosphatase MutT (NUDIX family)
MSDTVPIFHIPPGLHSLAVPLRTWLKDRPNYDRLVVGALVFAYKPGENHQPRLLLVQRSADERAFPGCWEIPGGSAEASDPTILHSVAREVFEETGLRLSRFVRQVGEGVEFVTPAAQGGSRQWLKLSFEIEAAEIPGAMQGNSLFNDGDTHPQVHGDDTDIISILEDIPIVLDPKEHQLHEWVTEVDIDQSPEGEGRYTFISADQRHVVLDGFSLHKADREQVKEIERIKDAMGNA